MDNTPPVYQGSEPYIFVSYAHKDSQQVLPIIQQLQNWGFRVWYDAGIQAGTEWPEYIASHLRDSAAVIAFISEAAINSPHCRQEITYAGAKHKDVLSIYLDDAELPAGLELQLGNNQSMFFNRSPNMQTFVKQLIMAELLRPCCAYPDRLPKPQQPYSRPPAGVPTPPTNTYSAPTGKAYSPAKKSPVGKILAIGLVIVAVIAMVIFLMPSRPQNNGGGNVDDGPTVPSTPAEKYEQAIRLIKDEEYYEAYVLLQELGDYEDSQVQLALIEEKALIQKIASSKRGEIVIWGSYEQNNDTSDGAEPIEWVILHSEDGRTLLLSKYGLDSRPFHDEEREITWEKCDLRAWLHEKFYHEAFTGKQQAYIFEVTNETEGSADTRDKVFLLSEEEALVYKTVIPTMEATQYAIFHGARNFDTYWWLRSPWSESLLDWADVGYFDMENTTMHEVNKTGIAVRPCIWVDTRSESKLEEAYITACALFDTAQYKQALEAFQNLGNYKDSADYCERLPRLITMQPFMEAEIGEEVTLGDHDFIVLDKQEDRVLIISKYALGTRDYHSYSMDNPTWEESTLRQWLNEEFLNSQLGATSQELELILVTALALDSEMDSDISSDYVTYDRVFLLSEQEVYKYLPRENDRLLYIKGKEGTPVSWWLRTTVTSGSFALYVNTYGVIDPEGAYVFQLDPQQHVRPAMWIDIIE